MDPIGFEDPVDWIPVRISSPTEQADNTMGNSNSLGPQNTSGLLQLPLRPKDGQLDFATGSVDPLMNLCIRTRPGQKEEPLSRSLSAEKTCIETRSLVCLSHRLSSVLNPLGTNH